MQQETVENRAEGPRVNAQDIDDIDTQRMRALPQAVKQ